MAKASDDNALRIALGLVDDMIRDEDSE